jgi:DNA-binding response OmpR family regulator
MKWEKPTRVLIVDDDDVDIRESLAEWLRRTHNFAVDTANDGAEAIDCVQKATGGYDITLMDLRLERGPDGIETMKAIRGEYTDIEVIIMTGLGGVDDGVRAMKAGAFAYVFKPLNYEEIVVYIRSAAERRQLKAAGLRKDKRLKALQEVGQEINKANDPVQVQDVILEFALKLTGAHFGAILQWNTDNTALVFCRVYPLAENLSLATHITQIPLPGGINKRIGITGRAARDKRTIRIADVTRDPDYIAYITDIRSEMSVPLIYGGKCIGVLDVEHREVDAFSEEDQEFLEALAHQAAIALRDHVNINRILKIRSEIGFNFVCLASLFEPVDDAEVLLQGAKEFETLFRKLFHDQIEVLICGHPREYESAFFIRAELRAKVNEQLVEIVIGCGKQPTFKQKRKNYPGHVSELVGVRDAREISYAETPHYAAAAYSLGSPWDRPGRTQKFSSIL